MRACGAAVAAALQAPRTTDDYSHSSVRVSVCRALGHPLFSSSTASRVVMSQPEPLPRQRLRRRRRSSGLYRRAAAQTTRRSRSRPQRIRPQRPRRPPSSTQALGFERGRIPPWTKALDKGPFPILRSGRGHLRPNRCFVVWPGAKCLTTFGPGPEPLRVAHTLPGRSPPFAPSFSGSMAHDVCIGYYDCGILI